jgi:transposase InsO family protein
VRTRPYTPRTNGKAEAFVKVLINSWAYARPYADSHRRSAALGPFLDLYNHRRPHGGLNAPGRSTGSRNDVRGNYS